MRQRSDAQPDGSGLAEEQPTMAAHAATTPAPDLNDDPRRDRRFAISIPVSLEFGKSSIVGHTSDVSMRGFFLRTAASPPPSTFVKLVIDVPSGESLTLSGRVAHIRSAEPDRVPGLGVQFYGNGHEELRAWMDFVTALRAGTAAVQAIRGVATVLRL
jgi:PilZ domain